MENRPAQKPLGEMGVPPPPLTEKIRQVFFDGFPKSYLRIDCLLEPACDLAPRCQPPSPACLQLQLDLCCALRRAPWPLPTEPSHAHQVEQQIFRSANTPTLFQAPLLLLGKCPSERYGVQGSKAGSAQFCSPGCWLSPSHLAARRCS